MYRIPAKPGWVEISGKRLWVDSQLEAKVLRWLEANGFADRWDKTNMGAVIGKSRYTPDIELAVELDGTTHRAIVEIKPYITAFRAKDIRRMQGIAGYYKTKLLLLYADREKSWYRIDTKTGEQSSFDTPIPGHLPIKSLPKSFSLTSQISGKHAYHRPFSPLRWFAELLEFIILGPKRKPKNHRRKRRNW